MRLRRPILRFRLWMMMLAVAVAALGLWADAMRRRSERFRAYAVYLAGEERRYLKEAESSDENAAALEGFLADSTNERDKEYWTEKIGVDRHNSSICREFAESFGSARLRYDRAARYPWLSIAPEPPDPSTSPEPE